MRGIIALVVFATLTGCSGTGAETSASTSSSGSPAAVASADDLDVCGYVKKFLSEGDLVGILKDARDEGGYLTTSPDGLNLKLYGARFLQDYEIRSDLSPAIKSPLGQLATSFASIRQGEIGNPLQAFVDSSAARGILDSTNAIKSACKTLGAK